MVRKKVCYIFPRYPARSEPFASSDIRMLEEMGVSVKAFSLIKQRDTESLKKKRGIHSSDIYEVGLASYIKGVFSALKNPILAFRLAKLCMLDDIKTKEKIKLLLLIPPAFIVTRKISDQMPDVIHLFWGHYTSLVGYLSNTLNPEVDVSIFLGAYDMSYGFCVTSHVLNTASHVFTHAEVNVDDIKSKYNYCGNVEVVRRGVDVNKLICFIDDDNQGLIKDDGLVLMCACRLVKSKRVDRTIYILSYLRRLSCNASLIVAGDGPERDNLIRLAADLGVSEHVNFTGHVGQEDIFQLMNKSDIFVLMSEAPGERLPNVLKEAMFLGCVPITRYSSGIEELVSVNESGLVFNNESDLEVSQSLIDLFKDFDKLHKMRRIARMKIHADFNGKNQMKRYIDVWGLELEE